MRTLRMLAATLVLATAACHTPGLVNTANRLPPEVTGPTWRWVSTLTVYGELRPDARAYTLHFLDNGRAQIEAGCKAGTASVGVGDNRQIQIGTLDATRNDCPGGDRIADEFLTDMGRARQWTLKDGDLYLGHPGDAAGLHFTPATATTP
jgi:heat shock protein HslJ